MLRTREAKIYQYCRARLLNCFSACDMSAADDIYFPYNAVILGNPAFFQRIHGFDGFV